MENKKLIIDLYDKISEEFNDYLVVNSVLDKIDVVLNDYKKIDILDEHLEMFDEMSGKIIKYIKFIIVSNIGVNDENIDLDEIKESIKYIKDSMSKKLNGDAYYYEGLWEMTSHFKNLKNILDNDIISEYGVILEFIEACYKEKMISVEDAVNLNFDIINSLSKEPNIVDEEVVELEENIIDISEDLRLIFSKYGYDYDKLENQVKEKFNKYAKVDYVDYVLDKLNKYHVSVSDVVKNQKTIFRIIIDKENNSFDEICQFVNDNNCTLSGLLSMASIFHKGKKIYMSKDTILNSKGDNNSDDGLSLDEDLTVVGTFDNFIANINMLKSIEGDFKISDEYLKKKKTFINESNDKIVSNLITLRRYGLCGEGELPKDFSCLIGNATAYQIDRFIEVGLFDYIKKNLSYVSKPKNPYKFYKIRRGKDLGDVITTNYGMKSIYTDDKLSVHGISMDKVEGVVKIVQDDLDIDTLKTIPESLKRDIRSDRLEEEEYYKRLNNSSYMYNVFSPTKMFFKNGISPLSDLVESVLAEDDYCSDFSEDVLNDKYIRMLDTCYCKTTSETEGETEMYYIKKDENTYVFRPFNFPLSPIVISRQKVLRLCSLLMKNGVWINDNFSLEDKTDLLLSVIVKDSVLSKWELSYLRNILKTVISNTVDYKKGGKLSR